MADMGVPQGIFSDLQVVDKNQDISVRKFFSTYISVLCGLATSES